MGGILVVNLRGGVNVPYWAKRTLALMKLNTRFRATIVRDSPETRGMLSVVKDYVAWSPADVTLITKMLEKRGRVRGDKPITKKIIEGWGFKSMSELATALSEGEIIPSRLEGLKSFALNSPKGGFSRSRKKGFKSGGMLAENPELPIIVKTML
jgi:large subunit ribosomal protein L30